MNYKNLLFGHVAFIVTAFSARSQIFSPDINPTDSTQRIVIQRENSRQDSLVKIVMKDSLHLSNPVIAQIFSTRQTFFTQVQQVRTDALLTPAQRTAQLRNLLIQADAAIKDLMGTDAYLRYGAMEQMRLLFIF